MEKSDKNVGWKRGIINILIGLALGVLLIEFVEAVRREDSPPEQRIRRLHHEGDVG
jgi:hypothetical protein